MVFLDVLAMQWLDLEAEGREVSESTGSHKVRTTYFNGIGLSESSLSLAWLASRKTKHWLAMKQTKKVTASFMAVIWKEPN